VIYRAALTKLADSHPDRLRVVHTLTREENVAAIGPSVRKGRVDTTLLTELIPDPSACLVYLCGPGISKFDRDAAKAEGTTPQPRFIEAALASLQAIGVPDKKIRRESYG